ncbi:MAG: nucleoside-diphosphate kinase [Deltaproteobacteria bacterium]|nr:nucleoside-diphosphate kinase [Deltaproteobacteria bacterium]
MQRTLAIIKPDSVELNLVGKIVACIEERFHIVGMKMLRLSKVAAERFYIVHKDKPFYDELVGFMMSGPIFVMVLEGENVIKEFRHFVGATDPKKAEENTIRKMCGTSIRENAIHGSDSEEAANFEIHFFFSDLELVRWKHGYAKEEILSF